MFDFCFLVFDGLTIFIFNSPKVISMSKSGKEAWSGEASLPIAEDGSIKLIARAWDVRGITS